VSEQRLWERACAYPSLAGVRLTKPAAPPWLVVGLLPDGIALTANDPFSDIRLSCELVHTGTYVFVLIHASIFKGDDGNAAVVETR
jgi:hypothetical protein